MPGLLRFMGSQRVGHDWATDLIWSGEDKIWELYTLWQRLTYSQIMLLDIFSNMEFSFAYFLFIFRNDISMEAGWGKAKMALLFFLICTSLQCIRSSAQGISHYLNICSFSLSCQWQILSIEISLFVKLT